MSRSVGGIERVKRELRILFGREMRHIIDCHVPVMICGSEYGGAAICPTLLGRGSIVYSLGVGEDISFDLDVIASFGVIVHAFDPIPRSAAYVSRLNTPEQYNFHQVAISANDGEITLYPPADPDHVSHSVVRHQRTWDRGIPVPCRRLLTIAEEMHHGRISLIKMDIEGAEYRVIDDLIQSRLQVDQIVIEFHHRILGLPLEMTRNAVMNLRDNGYKVFAVSPRGHEVSFLRTELCMEVQARR